MTFEQRMAELGVDLSDLPKPTKNEYAYECSNSKCLERLRETINNFEEGPSGVRAYVDYILHLVDIIDRMETRLVNVTGERDYLASEIADCQYCARIRDDERCETCDETFSNFEFRGVPEGWSAN